MPETLQPKLMGARVKRVEDPRFLLGRGRYIDDIVLPGMLHAAFVRSPFPHGDIISIEREAALGLEGIHGVMTGQDIVGRAQPIACDSMYPTWQGSLFPALAADRVRFAGEAVAAVVAESRYQAEDAAEVIEVEYEPREAVASIQDAVRPDAPRLHEGWEDNFFVKRHYTGGDPDAAFSQAHGRLRLEMKNHRHSGIPLETRGCIAEYDPVEGQLTLWTSTQIPHLVRTGLADSLGMPENRIRVVAPELGGGFGIKGHLFPEEITVAVLAMDTGRPVKWIEDRREHLLACIHAREHEHTIEVAYSEEGEILALRAEIYVDCGAYSVYPWTATMDGGMALGILPGPYLIRNYECSAFSVATNKCPLGPYRGVARPAACFSIERTMDKVAEALNMDPVEIRRRNLVKKDQFPYTSVTGLVYDSGSFVEALDKVCELADYDGLRRMQEEERKRGRYLGIGVATYTEQTAHTTNEFIKRGVPIIFGYDTAIVRMDPSGGVTVYVSTHSHGQGHETTIAQLVADELAIPLQDVKLGFGDTSNTPYGMGTFASRSAVLAGGAAQLAATRVKNMLVKFGAHHLETDENDVELEAGAVRVKGASSRAVSVSQLARWAYHRPEKLPEGMDPILEWVSSYDAGPGTGTFANSAQVAVVDVDPETGGVKVLSYKVVEDCGRMINPTIVEGQVHGGIAQGLGGALMEELIYDSDGQPLTTTFLDYLLPGTTDIPSIEVAHLETPSPFTIGGIKGMGEGGAIAPGAVLAAAVEDAIRTFGSVFVNEVPLTPQRVRHFVEEASDGAATSGTSAAS
jgi:carbon-monoxide dehydrogenase large subunit